MIGVLLAGTIALTQTTQFAGLWANLVDSHSPFLLTAFGGWLAVFVPFMLNGFLHLALDLAQWPQALYKYKIQPKPIDTTKLPRLFGMLAVNFLIVMTALSCVMGWLTARDMGLRVSSVIPAWHEILLEFVAFGAMHEPVFFYTHRLMHWGPLYRCGECFEYLSGQMRA
jgi:hypothetical protein